jgi:HEAT repeat protein
MISDFKASIIQIWDSRQKQITGTGFMVGPRLVMTCAHVIRAARLEPGCPVMLKFWGNEQPYTAGVDASYWSPPDQEDIALLRLDADPPPEAVPLPLGFYLGGKERNFRTFGYPEQGALSGGGQIVGWAEIGAQRLLQLRSPEVKPGFSGAPVWDDDLGQVIGIVTGILPPDRYGRLGTTALAAPVQTLQKVCPELVTQAEALESAYLKAVEAEWSRLDLGDFQAPLDQVYVMLEAVESQPPSPMQKRDDLADNPERMEHAGLRETSRQRRDLGGMPLEELKEKEPKKALPMPLSKTLAQARHLALLGEPGSGKSVTLQFIGLCFARPGWAKERLELDEAGVPVLVRLGRVGHRLQETGCRLLEDCLIPIVQEKATDFSPAACAGAVQRWYDAGRLVLLLDGLDEVDAQHRPAVSEKIAAFQRGLRSQNCRVVLSSRPAGYAAPGIGLAEYRLQPFDSPTAAQGYLQHWLAVLRPDWGDQAAAQSEKLLAEIRRSLALQRLTDNPLLLRMLAENYAATGQVAAGRSNLYRQYLTETIWEWRAASRQIKPAERLKGLDDLEVLAWAMQQNQPLPAGLDLELLRQQLGLLVAWWDGLTQRLAFSHKTFQEYFVARHLQKAWEKDPRRVWAFLRPRLHHPAWREPILLLVGGLPGEALNDLARRILAARSPYEKLLRRDLRLAAAILNERRDLDARLTRSILTKLIHFWEFDTAEVLGSLGSLAIPSLLQALKDKDKEVRKRAANILGKIKDPAAVPALLRTLKDEDIGVRRMVDLALDRIKDPTTVAVLIQSLENEEDAVLRWEVARVLGKIKDPAAVPALRQTLKDENVDVRRWAATALGMIKDPTATPDLLQVLEDEDVDVRRRAAEALRAIEYSPLFQMFEDVEDDMRREAAWVLDATEDPTAVPALIQALKEEGIDVRCRAARILGAISDPAAVPALLQALRNENRDVRLSAASALGKIKDPAAVPALLQALEDKDVGVQGFATEALGRIQYPTAIPALLQALKEKDAGVRSFAAEALGRIQDPTAVPALLQALKDENWFVRRSAVEALGAIQDPTAVPVLLQALKEDGDWRVRGSTAWALGETEDPIVVPVLLQALKDDSWYVRSHVVWALGVIQGAAAVPALLQVLKEDRAVHREAARALGAINDPAAVAALLQALEDEDRYVRWEAAWVLGEIKDPMAVATLLQALKNEDADVRRAAVWVLGEIEDPMIVPSLLQAFKDDDQFVRWEADRALRAIEDSSAVPLLLQALKDENRDVRRRATRALADRALVSAIEDSSTVPALLQALEDEDRDVRRDAAKALSWIKDPTTVPALLQALKDEDWDVRQEAAQALGSIQNPTTVSALLQAFKDGRIGARFLTGMVDQIDNPNQLRQIIRSYTRRKGSLGTARVDADNYSPTRRLALTAGGPPQKVGSKGTGVVYARDRTNYAGWTPSIPVDSGTPRRITKTRRKGRLFGFAKKLNNNYFPTFCGKTQGKSGSYLHMHLDFWSFYELKTFADRLYVLEAEKLSADDPLLPRPPPPRWRRALSWLVRALLAALVVLAGALVIDLLTSQFSLQGATWPWLLALAALALLLIIVEAALRRDT